MEYDLRDNRVAEFPYPSSAFKWKEKKNVFHFKLFGDL